MTVETFTFNPFMTNSYVLADAGEAVLVDPSSHTETEHRQVLRYLEDEGLIVQHLLLTHGHIDHIFGCAFFAEHFGMEWQMHAADRPLVDRAREQAAAFGVTIDAAPPIREGLEEGDTVTFGGVTLHVRHTPGHSPGSVTFVHEGGRRVVSGDVLFQGSIGRTQGLPRTSLPQLLASIREQLLPMDDDVVVHPGHGASTTIGRERRSNPFLQEDFMRANS